MPVIEITDFIRRMSRDVLTQPDEHSARGWLSTQFYNQLAPAAGGFIDGGNPITLSPTEINDYIDDLIIFYNRNRPGAGGGPAPPPGPAPRPRGGAAGVGRLHGRVVDAVTGDPVPNVSIFLVEDTGFNTRNLADGSYTIDGITPPGGYTIKTRANGYHEYKKAISVARNRVTSHEIKLLPEYDKLVDGLKAKHGLNDHDVDMFLHSSPEEVERELKKHFGGATLADLLDKNKRVRKSHDKYGKAMEEGGKKYHKLIYPDIAKKPIVETGRIFGGVTMAVVGFIISAILGSMSFTWGFLLLAVAIVIPGDPNILESTQKEIESIRSKYKAQIKSLMSQNKSEEAKNVSETMNNEIEAAKSLGEGKWEMRSFYNKGAATVGLKTIFKIVGIVFLLFGIGDTGFPLAKIIAIAGGFVAYFTISVTRSLPEPKKAGGTP